jgi:hypothetical protein
MAKAKQSGEKLYAYSLRERLQLPKVNVSGEIVGARGEGGKVVGAVPFVYTSPSARPKTSMAQRREAGCRFVKQTNKSGKQVTKLDPRDAMRPECQPQTSAPCATARASCPVQLVFSEGRPALRFCMEKGERGPAKYFSDVEEAAEFAMKACAEWSKNGRFNLATFKEGLIGPGKRRKKKPKRRDAVAVAAHVAQRKRGGAHTDKRDRRGKQQRAWRDEE